MRICSSCKSDCIQIISVVALARLRYSASVPDIETMCCFFEDQATAFSPKNMQNPVMLLRPSVSFPQSASEKLIKDRREERLRVRP